MARASTAVLISACICFGTSLHSQGSLATSALEGAWKLRSLSIDGKDTPATGYMIFHGNHYAFVTNRERPKLTAEISRKPTAQLSEAEKNIYVEAFRSMTAAAGPYAVEGDTIVYLMEVARSPHLVGATERRKSRLEGNRLIQDFEGGGRRQVMVWERASNMPDGKK